MSKRKQHHPEYKANVALELSELASRFGVYLHACESGSAAKAGVGKWMEFYSHKRPHSALGGRPPAVVYWQSSEIKQPDQQE